MLSSHTVNTRPIYEVSVSSEWGSCEVECNYKRARKRRGRSSIWGSDWQATTVLTPP